MNYHQQPSQSFTYPTESSGDINWAQLAQRWIQTQHSQQQLYPAHPPPPPPPPLPSRLPYSHGVASAPLFHGMAPSPSPPNRTPGPGFFPTPLSQVSVGPPQNIWRPPPNWVHPSFNIGYQSHGMASVANYSYSQSKPPSDRQDEEEYQAHYDPSLEQEESTDQRPPELSAPQGAMTHWMANPWNALMYPSNYMPIIDTQMRKKLPAWILEGLEKAEKEKQKKMEKEEFEKKKKEREDEKQRQREAKGIGKFEDDSDEDDEADDKNEINDRSSKNVSQPVPRKFREFVETNKTYKEEEIEDTRTDNQRMEEALMLVRHLVTAVLLEMTNREFERIAYDILTKGKTKAQPKILAQSSALAALTSLIGNDDDLSSSEDEENEQSKKLEMAIETKNDSNSEEKEEEKQKEAKHGKNNAETNGGSEPVVFKVPLAPPQVKRREGCDELALHEKEHRNKEENKRTKNKTEVGRDQPRKSGHTEGGTLSTCRSHEKASLSRTGHRELAEHKHYRGRDDEREGKKEREKRDDRERRAKTDRRRDKDLPAQYRSDTRDRYERERDRKRRRSRSRSPSNKRYQNESSPRH